MRMHGLSFELTFTGRANYINATFYFLPNFLLNVIDFIFVVFHNIYDFSLKLIKSDMKVHKGIIKQLNCSNDKRLY